MSTMRNTAPFTSIAAGLLALSAALWGCSASNSNGGTDLMRTGGSSGSSAAGGSSGSGGATASGGSTGSGGGSETATGGSPGSTGGSGSAETGGSGGGSADAGGTPGTGGTTESDAAATPDAPSAGDAGTHKLDPNSPIVACKPVKPYHLDPAKPADPEDFCTFYEMYCPYDPTGMKASGSTPAPAFYKDRADCVASYTKASPTAKSCRAGQLCTNKSKGPGVAGNPCTHATGHHDDCM